MLENIVMNDHLIAEDTYNQMKNSRNDHELQILFNSQIKFSKVTNLRSSCEDKTNASEVRQSMNST